MTGINRLILGTSLLAVVALAGCQKQAPQPAPTEGTGATAATAAAPTPHFSVNELMVMVVDQPGELLWDVEKGHEPKSDEDWYQLENHAVSLASAATLIQLGGTGPNDAKWAADPQWRALSEKLASAALVARGAAKAKDLGALVKANGGIVDSCEACHAKFKPELPTGGLLMHRRPGKY